MNTTSLNPPVSTDNNLKHKGYICNEYFNSAGIATDLFVITWDINQQFDLRSTYLIILDMKLVHSNLVFVIIQ